MLVTDLSVNQTQTQWEAENGLSKEWSRGLLGSEEALLWAGVGL